MRSGIQSRFNNFISRGVIITSTRHTVSEQKVVADYPKPTVTLGGEEVTLASISRHIRSGDVRLRGAAKNESPFYNDNFGIISRGDIQGESGVRLHTEKTIGISTTCASSIAMRFALGKFLKGTHGSVHAICGTLIPEADKTFVPSVNGIDEAYLGEMETVFHNCVPKEMYLGHTSISAWLLATTFHVNSSFVDGAVLKQDAALLKLFYDTIYEPFKTDIGPKIREGKLTDAERDRYQAGRATFHNQYRLFAQTVATRKKTEACKTPDAVESPGVKIG